MIDFHSHILPGVDDGSRDVTESISMLDMLASQGVDTVAATPHFNANKESADDFLIRRDEAFESLRPHLSKQHPKIICGAEVEYYPGIGRMPQLQKLCISSDRLLLLEMPMTKWTDYTVKELAELAGTGRITVILAHIERYMGLQSKNTVYRLYESGILMQVNASFFVDLLTKRKAISMLSGGEIHLIGSDCHNTSTRAPRIGKAFEAIEKKLGAEFVRDINEFGHTLLEKI